MRAEPLVSLVLSVAAYASASDLPIQCVTELRSFKQGVSNGDVLSVEPDSEGIGEWAP
jgi:hypothetical protein